MLKVDASNSGGKPPFLTCSFLINQINPSIEQVGFIKEQVGSDKEQVGSTKGPVSFIKEQVNFIKEQVGFKEQVGSIKGPVSFIKEQVNFIKEQVGFKEQVGSIKGPVSFIKEQVYFIKEQGGFKEQVGSIKGPVGFIKEQVYFIKEQVGSNEQVGSIKGPVSFIKEQVNFIKEQVGFKEQVGSIKGPVSFIKEQVYSIKEQVRKGGLPPLLLAFCFLALSVNVFAQIPRQPGPSSPLYGGRPEAGSPSTGLPTALRDVGLEQKLDQQLPLDLVFRDESGQDVKLGRYFGQKPVILALVYYDCPMLCTQVLNGMVTSFRVLPFHVGKEFDVVTVSFDPRETSALATTKKKVYVNYLPEKMRPAATNGWHFLTGDEASIAKLTDAVGFRYHYDEATKQFAHASGIMLATPHGKLSRYFYGIEYAPRDLRLGLIESSANKIGSPVDQLLLYCYHYDPATGKYGAAVMRIMRIAGVLTVLTIVAMLFALKRRKPIGGAAQ